jgi:hypothetical protein
MTARLRAGRGAQTISLAASATLIDAEAVGSGGMTLVPWACCSPLQPTWVHGRPTRKRSANRRGSIRAHQTRSSLLSKTSQLTDDSWPLKHERVKVARQPLPELLHLRYLPLQGAQHRPHVRVGHAQAEHSKATVCDGDGRRL